MFLDFDDLHPESPRLDSALSRREGILLSLVVHGVFVVLLLFGPSSALFAPADSPEILEMAERDMRDEPLRFVEAVPLRELPTPPRFPAEQSDLDRRSTPQETTPEPESIQPFARGNTPEYIVGGPTSQPETPGPPEPEVMAEAAPPTLPEDDGLAFETPRTAGNLGGALQNLEQYLRDENFDNPTGGQVEQSADIQFDTMGVDFGPWLLRFKRQVERNWIVPPAAMTYRGSTVIQFYVLRNGRLVDLSILQPAGRPALTNSALNALKLSNPTAALPPEYPIDRAFITVTFHYNQRY